MSRVLAIATVLILALLVIGGYFLWWPKYQDFKIKNTELRLKGEEIGEKEQYLHKLKSYSESLAEYANEISKIETALPIEPSKPSLFNFLLKTSSENGLILDSLDIGNIKKTFSQGERIKEIPLSVSVSGSYPAFKNFLSTLYRNSRLFEIDFISFSSPTETERGEVFTFNVAMRTYAYQELKTEKKKPAQSSGSENL